MKKYDCDKDIHPYARDGICKKCGAKNPKVYGNKYYQNRQNKMPQFYVKYTTFVFGTFETTIRASSQGCAETRIRYAIRDLFGGLGGGRIIEIKQIKGETKSGKN